MKFESKFRSIMCIIYKDTFIHSKNLMNKKRSRRKALDVVVWRDPQAFEGMTFWGPGHMGPNEGGCSRGLQTGAGLAQI